MCFNPLKTAYRGKKEEIRLIRNRMQCAQIMKDYGRIMLRKPTSYNALTNNTLNKNIAPFKQAKIGIVYITF